MPFGHRSARRRGMLVGAAVANKRAAARSATPQPAPEAAVTADDTVEQIKKLAELRDQGILTEEEFSAKKKLILGI
ncbi:MAG: SHOCT domain-containing protein [Candidatus Saccharimonas sp.]